MKINKQKHGKENTIGKIIYGFLMFMPLMAILVTCAYVIFNKNAYHSYSGQNENERQLTETNLLKVDEEYFISFNNYSSLIQTSSSFEITDIDNLVCNDSTTLNNINNIIDRVNNLVFANNGTTNMYISFKENNTSLLNVGVQNKILSFDFISESDIELNQQYKDFIYKIDYNLNYYADNVFYYSINKVEQSPLFSWATNTGTHNVLESTCQTLGITTPFVPMLLAYWLMTSLMYLLYDIALLVVHMAHNRIHDIESSI